MTTAQASAIAFIIVTVGVLGACVTALAGSKAFSAWNANRATGIIYTIAATVTAAITITITTLIWGAAT